MVNREGSPPLSRRPVTRPSIYLAIHRRDWLPSELVDLLRGSSDVHVSELRLRAFPGRSGSTRVMSKPELVLTELVHLLRLAARRSLYRGDWRFVCYGGHFATILYGRLLGLVGIRRKTYLVNFYLHSLAESPLVRGFLRVAMTPDVFVVAQTRADAEYFADFLPSGNVEHLPYCLSPSAFVEFDEAEIGDYVFSGGWTNRDYDALFRCARRLPDVPFVVVASRHSRISEPPPPNVRLLLDLSPGAFDRLLAGSRVVVIPLEHDVGSSGQMVLLAAMQFAKPAVVPGFGAVADYVDDGRTGTLYAAGDDEALRAAVAGLYADVPRARRIGAAARAEYLRRFTPESFNRPLAEYLART
jgi:glycosyltransferase involved in cell wall biosynthesis